MPSKRIALFIILFVLAALAGTALAVLPGEHEVSKCDTATAAASVPDVLYGDGGTRTGTIPGATDTQVKQVCVTATATDQTVTGPTTTVTTTVGTTAASPPSGQVLYRKSFEPSQDPNALEETCYPNLPAYDAGHDYCRWYTIAQSSTCLSLGKSFGSVSPFAGSWFEKNGVSTVQDARCELGKLRRVDNGSDDYYHLAVYLPSASTQPLCPNGSAAFDQLNYQSINAAPFFISACDMGSNQVTIFLLGNAGQAAYATNSQFYSGRPKGYGNWLCRGYPAANCGPWTLIGTLPRNQWVEWVVHVRWTVDNDGVVEGWWRPQGGTWAKTVDERGAFPTLQWGTDTWPTPQVITQDMVRNNDPTLHPTQDKFGQYSQGATSASVVYFDSWCRATSFDVAAGC